eukprot:scaffold168124_cov16-Tisochrysis_lutea.AAC.1
MPTCHTTAAVARHRFAPEKHGDVRSNIPGPLQQLLGSGRPAQQLVGSPKRGGCIPGPTPQASPCEHQSKGLHRLGLLLLLTL